MQKTILITGSTDGIGLETAKMLVSLGHFVLLHGRSSAKLEKTKEILFPLSNDRKIESYLADLSSISDVENFAQEVIQKHNKIDVLVNNAGILKAPETITQDGLDVRFAVNTIAPYLLTRELLPLFDKKGRIINLSSAAQSTVDLEDLAKHRGLDNMPAYSQSKLALTMWSFAMANLFKQGPSFIAVNPGSLLATKMVKEGFGLDGNDIQIGANILVRTALEKEFANVSGKYFDNDLGQFSSPHADALSLKKCEEVVSAIENILAKIKSD